MFNEPTEEELRLLDNFRSLTDADRERFTEEIAKAAAVTRKAIDDYIKGFSKPPKGDKEK